MIDIIFNMTFSFGAQFAEYDVQCLLFIKSTRTSAFRDEYLPLINIAALSPTASDAIASLYVSIARAKGLLARASLAVIATCTVTFTATDTVAENASVNGPLSLPVVSVVERYPPYADFCVRHPRECNLTGPNCIPHSPDILHDLEYVNAAVNGEIKFMLDISQYSKEDYWALPTSGYGDCEDLALEKRSRLVKLGFAQAALRLAFVSHRRLLNSHCILTVETSKGTYILDSYSNKVSRWDQAPYNFEARERTDGLWDRFDQTHWRYER